MRPRLHWRANRQGAIPGPPLPMKPLNPHFHDRPGRSPANRSLERGIELLRAFRPGSDVLGNGDLAERTGLARSTVTRLTQTLVGVGMLQADAGRRGYRLAPAVLSFAHSMRAGSMVLSVAAPRMRALAESRRINVGLAAPDRDEMVYLESIRYSRRVAFRNVVSGQRIPMELTSLGRAYLATAPEARRRALLSMFKRRRDKQWPALADAIEKAIESVHARGFCAASWQPEVVALATPLETSQGVYVLNVGVTTGESMRDVVRQLSGPLLKLRYDIQWQIAVRDIADHG
jgi:DNA-binding IclR family transcriptional regulator